MNSNISYVFSSFDRTVVLMNRESIDAMMKESGVNTLRGFNNMAIAIVKQFGAAQGVTIKEGEESLWTLGALAKADAEYLQSFIKSGETPVMVDLIAERAAFAA